MSGGLLVAGVGNIFLGDDGFGVEVVRRLAREPLPPPVKVVDFGIRSLHLAYALLEPIDLLLVVDTVLRDGPPGSLYLLEVNAAVGGPAALDGRSAGPHGTDLASALAAAGAMGARLPRMLLVGCQPARLDEEMGLSPEVERAVEPALAMVRSILEQELVGTARAAGEEAT